jgi:autotransporter-associated beta strand protein
MQRTLSLSFFSLVALFSCLSAGHTMAQSTWTGGTSTDWNDTLNWTGGIPTTSTILNFGGTPTNQPTNNDIVNLTTGNINFLNGGPAAVSPNNVSTGYILGGNAIILGGNITTSATTQISGVAAITIADTIGMSLTLNGLRTITTNSSGNGVNQVAHNLTISGLISESGGAQGLIKAGAATLTLSNTANSFTGPLSVQVGTLTVSSLDVSGTNSAIGAGSVINFGSTTNTGTLNFNGASAPSGIINRTLNLTGAAGGGTVNNNSAVTAAALVFNGGFTVANTAKTFTLGGTNTGANDFQSTLVNPSTGTLSFTKADGGTWTLSGANTYSGTTVISAGILNISTISDSGSSNIGIGTTMRLGNNNIGATLNYTGAGSTTARTVQIGLNAGTPAATNTGAATINNNGSSGALIFSAITFNAQQTNATTGVGANRVITLGGSNTAANEIQGTIQNNLVTSPATGTALIGVTKADAGLWILSGNNTYTGNNTVTAGTLQVNRATNGLGDSTAVSAINLNGGTLSLRNDGAGSSGAIIYGSTSNATGYNVQLSATSTINVANLTANTGNTVQLGALTQATAAIRSLNVTGANGYSLTLASLGLNPGTGQTTTLNPTTASLIITGNVNNPMSGFAASNFDTLTLDGTSTGNSIGGVISDAAGASIAAGGTTRITKSGTSTWTLSGPNTYLGLTTISGGTLSISSESNIGANPIAASATQLTFNGGTLRTTATFSIDDSNRGVTISGGGGTFETNAATTLTVANAIVGTGSLTKTGAGTLIFSNTGNTYSGGTLIDSGTLMLGAANVLPNNNVELKRSTTSDTNPVLDLNGFSDTIAAVNFGHTSTTVANAGGTQSIINSGGAATLTLGGAVTYRAGSTGFENGQATISANLVLISADNNDRIFQVGNGSADVDLLVTGNLTSVGSLRGLIKNGTGVMMISGINNYTGLTKITEGTLILGSDTALSTSPRSVTFQGGSLAANTTNPVLDVNGRTSAIFGLNLSLAAPAVGGIQSSVVDNAIVKGLITLGGDLTYNAGAGGALDNGQSTVSANLSLGAATRTFTVGDSTSAATDVLISGVLSGAAGSGMTKAGAGVLALSAANTYTGVTRVGAGTLSLRNNLALQNSALDTTGPGAITLDTGITTPTIGGLSGATGDLATIISSGYGLVTALTLNPNSGSVTYGGIIADGAAGMTVTKTGAGTQTFTGANSYTGGTTVNQGTLTVGTGGTLGATTGSLNVSNTNSTGPGTASILNLAAAVDTTVGSLSGTIATPTSGTNTATINTQTGRNFTINQTTAGTYSGVIAGAGSVTLGSSSTNTLTFTGANTYSGTTTVSAGNLQVGAAGVGTTGTGAVTVQSGGTILGTGTVRGSSFTAESGSIIHAGDGTMQTNYGTLNFTPASGSGAIDFQSGSSVILGINPGGTSDLLNIVGTGTSSLLFNGNLTVGPSSFTPVAAEIFNLLDWSLLGSTPTFASRYSAGSYSGLLIGNGDDNLGFDLPNLFGSSYAWDISSFTTNGSIAIVLVPEPSRAVLLLIGLVGLVTRRRR